jgi:hypothetical protein
MPRDDKRVKRLRSERPERIRVQNSAQKKLGGRTGKGFLPGRSGNPTGQPRR